MQKIYVDYAGSKFEAWTYSDGETVRFSMSTMASIRAYAKKHGYKLVLTDEAQLFDV